jgi:hypothetical protein
VISRQRAAQEQLAREILAGSEPEHAVPARAWIESRIADERAETLRLRRLGQPARAEAHDIRVDVLLDQLAAHLRKAGQW